MYSYVHENASVDGQTSNMGVKHQNAICEHRSLDPCLGGRSLGDQKLSSALSHSEI